MLLGTRPSPGPRLTPITATARPLTRAAAAAASSTPASVSLRCRRISPARPDPGGPPAPGASCVACGDRARAARAAGTARGRVARADSTVGSCVRFGRLPPPDPGGSWRARARSREGRDRRRALLLPVPETGSGGRARSSPAAAVHFSRRSKAKNGGKIAARPQRSAPPAPTRPRSHCLTAVP